MMNIVDIYNIFKQIRHLMDHVLSNGTNVSSQLAKFIFLPSHV